MCYSAMAWSEYMRFLRVTDADVSFYDYWKIYGETKQGWLPLRTPKAMDLAFANPKTDIERQIWQAIVARNQAETAKLEQEIFKQRKRLADAERTLQTKTTKKALEDQRIATTKVTWALEKLADLRRTTIEPRDSRIYPGWYTNVMVMENGRRVVKPMRYQCRPAGKPAAFDQKYPGTYNARRDSLDGYWRDLFGTSHGVAIFDAFYENVSRHKVEGRELAPGEKEENVILEFRPEPAQPMFVACLWSRWGECDEELLSFAAITDDPPPEIAAAGHDRVIIPIKPENIAMLGCRVATSRACTPYSMTASDRTTSTGRPRSLYNKRAQPEAVGASTSHVARRMSHVVPWRRMADRTPNDLFCRLLH